MVFVFMVKEDNEYKMNTLTPVLKLIFWKQKNAPQIRQNNVYFIFVNHKISFCLKKNPLKKIQKFQKFLDFFKHLI